MTDKSLRELAGQMEICIFEQINRELEWLNEGSNFLFFLKYGIVELHFYSRLYSG